MKNQAKSVLHKFFNNSARDFWVYTAVVSLVIAVLLTYMAVDNSVKDHNKQTYGNYDGIIVDCNSDDIKDLSTSCVISLYGYADFDNVGYVSMGSINDTIAQALSLSLLDGRFPSAPGEVCIEESVRYVCNDLISDNGILTIPFYDYNGYEQYTDVIVVGTISNYSTVQCQFPPEIKGIELPGILFAYDPLPCAHTLTIVNKSEGIEFSQVEGFISNLKHGLKTPLLILLLQLYAGISLAIGIICICGNHRINSKNNSQKIALLKCAGATRRYIFVCMIRTNIISLLSALAWGTTIGISLSYFVVYGIRHMGNKYIAYEIDWLRLFFLIILISLTFGTIILVNIWEEVNKRPLNNLRKERASVVSNIKLSQNFFLSHPLISRSIKSFIHKSETYIIPLLCLVAINLVVSESWVQINSINDYYNDDINFDYSITTSGYVYASDLEIAVPDGYPFKERDIQACWKTQQISNCIAYSYRRAFFIAKNADESQRLSDSLDNIEFWAEQIKYGRWESVKKMLNNLGYHSENLYVTSLYAGNDAFINELVQNSDISSDGAVYVCSDESPFAVGDSVNITFAVMDDENNIIRKDIQVKIERIVSSKSLALINNLRSNCICINADLLNELGCNYGYDNLHINLINTSNYDLLEEVTSQIEYINNDDNIEVVSHREYNKEIKNAKDTVLLISISISICAILILAINIYNVLYSALKNQKYSFLMLPLLGMSSKQIKKNIFCEMMIINILASLIGSILVGILIMIGGTAISGIYVLGIIVSSLINILLCTGICTTIYLFLYKRLIRSNKINSNTLFIF